MNERELDGKVAVITGASKGLGKAMALALGAAGANIALVARDVDQLNGVKQELENLGGQAQVFPADLLEEEQIRTLEKNVMEAFGGVHILINNAGINLRKPLVEFTLEEWHRVLDTNLTSVFLLCRSFVPHMKGTGYGRVINMASSMSRVSLPGRSAYSASKTALLGLTRALALELADEGITVNAISPGPFATEMNTPLIQNSELNRQFLSKIPIGRWGRVEEIGHLALYLCLRRIRLHYGDGYSHGRWLDGPVARPLRACELPAGTNGFLATDRPPRVVPKRSGGYGLKVSLRTKPGESGVDELLRRSTGLLVAVDSRSLGLPQDRLGGAAKVSMYITAGKSGPASCSRRSINPSSPKCSTMAFSCSIFGAWKERLRSQKGRVWKAANRFWSGLAFVDGNFIIVFGQHVIGNA